jgi:phosphate transport system ATP-binding protein
MVEPALSAPPEHRKESAQAGASMSSETRPRLVTDKLTAMFGKFTAVKGVSLAFPPNRVHALIGPSGSGKSTFLRTLNRMHELSEHGWITGRVLLDGDDIYAPRVNVMQLRRRVGMVFQSPTPFPTMSVYDNVAAGLRLNKRLHRTELDSVVERSLRQAALWDEVKDVLGRSGASLSGGQQQRLCIARALAVSPEVILMDEPCSALDPIATLQIEELARGLAEDYAIVIVTHNMQQAARVSDETIFMSMNAERAGYVVEAGPTREIFTNPRNKLTEDYITGRFG